ncbi:MAG TPA: low molecular weight phosphotyrosine protein phosphatase [Hellea balneolensis]|uniref:protein-tyrosine-phosphatase n=1 Tax=Hellea balneolensis TaxID=287478 RepID=A0A7C3GD55_9PROT|nr:low molecular weight phosphotyrosine protein phosphatase [Hellea balneolensis]
MSAVLFVCLGNICRSPTAEAVFKHRAHRAGLCVEIDSAGTGAWHKGEAPDERAQDAGMRRGYDFSGQAARAVHINDFAHYDFIVAMDGTNLADLTRMCPPPEQDKLHLFLDFAADQSMREVPDPYYGGAGGFDHVLDLVEQASDGLIAHLQDLARKSG